MSRIDLHLMGAHENLRQATIRLVEVFTSLAAPKMPSDADRLTTSIEAIKRMELNATLPDSLEERSRRLTLACRGAAAIAWNRRLVGLPDPKPAPWPTSTWEFLSQHARQARQPAT
jgi:hypothetical protein